MTKTTRIFHIVLIVLFCPVLKLVYVCMGDCAVIRWFFGAVTSESEDQTTQ